VDIVIRAIPRRSGAWHATTGQRHPASADELYQDDIHDCQVVLRQEAYDTLLPETDLTNGQELLTVDYEG